MSIVDELTAIMYIACIENPIEVTTIRFVQARRDLKWPKIQSFQEPLFLDLKILNRDSDLT